MLTGAPVLLADINQSPVTPSVSSLHTNVESAYYLGEADDTGIELWTTDGSPEGTRLVKDLTPGLASSDINVLTTAGDLTYLFENNSKSLWRTDGTEPGTVELASNISLSLGAGIAAEGKAFFRNDSEIWVSDGTVAGTAKVAEGLETVYDMVLFKDRLIFRTQAALWSSDGTAEGTNRVAELDQIERLYAFDDAVYFTRRAEYDDAGELNVQGEIWASDGTSFGTRRIIETHPLVEQGEVSDLVKVGDKLLFTTACLSFGCTRTIYISDGTQESVQHVGELGNFGGPRVAFSPIVVEGQLFFIDGYTFRTIDTLAQTPTSDRYTKVQVAGGQLVRLGDKIYLQGLRQGSAGLFAIDTATEAATLAIDLEAAGIEGTYVTHLSTGHGRLYFGTSESQHGQSTHLFESDGTQANIELKARLDHTAHPRVVGDTLVVLGTIDGQRRVWNISGDEPVNLNPNISRNQSSVGHGDCEELWGFLDCYEIGPSLIGSQDGTLWFRAFDGKSPSLWKSDGTPEGTAQVADVIMAGRDASQNPSHLRLGDSIYYIGRDNDSVLLWATDLSSGEHRLIKKFEDTGGHGHAMVGAFGDHIIVGTAGGIWKSTGTTEGTVQLTTAAYSSRIQGTKFAGQLYFAATDAEHGTELWRTDGTEAGTEMVADIFQGVGSSNVEELVVADNTLFFTATDGVHGREVWAIRHDGDLPPESSPDEDNQTLVDSDVGLGEVGLLSDINRANSDSRTAVVVDSTYFFVMGTAENGSELWMSDGTDGGTRMVRDILAGPTSTRPDHLTAFGESVFFTAQASDGTRELWKSDGTEAGTLRVAASSAFGNGHVHQLIADDHSLYVSADDRLYVTDGTPNSVQLIPSRWAQLTPAGEHTFLTERRKISVLSRTNGVFHQHRLSELETSGDISPLESALGRLFFSVVECNQVGCQGELWSTDGTDEGTGPVTEAPTNHISEIEIAGQTLYMSIDRRLSSIDLSSESPQPIALSGVSHFFGGPLTAVGERVIYLANADDGTRELWVSDGTQETTQPVTLVEDSGISFSGDMMTVGNRLFLQVRDAIGNVQLRQVTSGTEGLSNSILGSFESAENFATDGNRLYFVAIEGREHPNPRVWVSDGTVEGTVPYGDSLAGMNRGSNPRPLFVHDQALYVTSTDSGGNREIWKTDGTAGGTIFVAQLPRDVYLQGASDPTTLSTSQHVFMIGSGKNGGELWASDGTDLVQLLAEDTIAAMQDSGSTWEPLASTETHAFFAPSFSVEDVSGVWVSDGTPEGTRRIAGAQFLSCEYFGWYRCMNDSTVVVDGLLYFTASNDNELKSLWVSDGTETGTHILKRTSLIAISSAAEVNGQIVMGASDGVRGNELWAFNPPPVRRRGDTNLDGEVDFADFLVLSNNFGKTVDAVWADGDFDGDGKVEFADFLILSGNFKQV